MTDTEDKDKPLTAQALRFVEEYLIDLSARGAAIRAGYSINTAASIGCNLLKDKRVQKAISKAQKRGADLCGITAARVLQELALIAFAKPGDMVTINTEGEAEVDLTKSSGAEVNVSMMDSGGRKSKAVTVKTVKPADKTAALIAIGKHLGMFTEKVEVSTNLTLKEMIEKSFIDETAEPTPISPQTQH